MQNSQPSTSWVIIRRQDEAVIFETFSRSIAQRINLKAYKVVPILDYLHSLNKRIKESTQS